MPGNFIVGVMGPADASDQELHLSRELGGLIAQNGWTALTSGRVGMTESVLPAAKKYGGNTVAIVLSQRKYVTIPYADLVIADDRRSEVNAIHSLISDVDVVISCRTSGARTGAALAIHEGKSVVLINPTSDAKAELLTRGSSRIYIADEPSQAIAIVRRCASYSLITG